MHSSHKSDLAFLAVSIALHMALWAALCIVPAHQSVSVAPGPAVYEVSLALDPAVEDEPELSATTPEQKQKAIPAPIPPDGEIPKKEIKKVQARLQKEELAPSRDSTPEEASVESTAAGRHAVGATNNDAYAAMLLAWLDKHKIYPPEARFNRVEGKVVIWLAVAADGTITDFRVEESSSSELLDAAARTLVQRASPVPPPPAAQGPREFRIPIVFSLKSSRNG